NQTVRSGNRLEPVVTFPNPWNDLPIVKPDDQLHVHRYFPTQPFDDPNNVGILAARGHEIDQSRGATFGFNFCLQNDSLASISSRVNRNTVHSSIGFAPSLR